MQASITTSDEAMADRVIELVNQERTSRGLQPLLKHDGLMVAAAARAKELSQRYSHTRPNGSECFTICGTWALTMAMPAKHCHGPENPGDRDERLDEQLRPPRQHPERKL